MMTQVNKQSTKENNEKGGEDRGCCGIPGIPDARFLKAIGDPTRLRILAHLIEAKEPQIVNEVSKNFPIDVSVVSRHLAILRDEGILLAEKQGKEVYYSVRYEFLSSILKSFAATIESCCASKAEDIGYRGEDLQNLPADLAESSFGCGNPLAFSEVHEGETVLDLGMGAGLDLLIASRKVGPTGKVIGIDMTDEMIARAREHIRVAGVKNAEVRKGLIENLPVESSSVDWVISNCVINLSPEKEKVFSEIFRVLKPGGQMSVSDIVVEKIPDWMREDKNLYCACISGAISEEEYISGLKKAGLEKINITERLVYKLDELESIFESPESLSCITGSINSKEAAGDKTVKSILDELTDKVSSIKISAYKPKL